MVPTAFGETRIANSSSSIHNAKKKKKIAWLTLLIQNPDTILVDHSVGPRLSFSPFLLGNCPSSASIFNEMGTDFPFALCEEVDVNSRIECVLTKKKHWIK